MSVADKTQPANFNLINSNPIDILPTNTKNDDINSADFEQIVPKSEKYFSETKTQNEKKNQSEEKKHITENTKNKINAENKMKTAVLTGGLCALTAFIMWGFFPVYFHFLRDVDPLVVLAFRAVFAMVFLIPVIFGMKRVGDVRAVLGNPRLFWGLLTTSVLVSVNWGVFIYLVKIGQALQSSLGCYINPFLTILLGVFFLREKLRPLAWFGIFCAFIAIVVFAFGIGCFPWGAITSASAFALYSLIRKKLNVDSLTALTVETILLTFPAILYLCYSCGCFTDTVPEIALGNSGNYWFESPLNWILLMGAGILTAATLLLFGKAAQNLNLATVGSMQYLIPTLQFFCAVFVLQESINPLETVSFSVIWGVLIFFALDFLFHKYKKKYNDKN